MAIHSLVGFDELNLHQALAERPLDFDSWTALISTVETKYSDEIDKLSLVYDSLLFEFPLCCGYWRKYAGHKARLCSVEEVVGVYEKAVESASFSVGIWVDYCCFAILIFEDPFEVSRLFRRGLSYIGKDYLCDALWDRYIEFEFSQKQWSALSRIHIEALKCPTKKLHQYYDSFKKLVTIWEEEMGCHGDSIVKLQPETRLDEEFAAPEDDEVFCIINDLLEPSTRFEALKKYSSIGERLYQRVSQLDLKIDCFEKNILRTYFHVKPLDDDQLENWHHYLDFVETNGDFDWAVKLYERCLIPCASYSEFWMRYVDYVESKGGREIANDALERATKTFLKDLPAIHLFDAGFKEKIGDVCGARAAFLGFDLHSESSFIDHAIRRANMEKRLGNNVAASNVYKEALAVATKEVPDALPILYLHYSRLQYMVTNSVDAARDILIGGIQTVANCKLLLEELITLAVHHEGARQLNILDPIVADAIIQVSDVSRGLSYEDRLHISELYLKFIDLCGTIHDSRRAWNRHIKLFPRPLRTNSTCMQPARASSRKEIFTVGFGTHDKALVIPKEVTRIDDMSPLIQRSADNTEDMKEAPNEDVTCKADEESCELVHKAADIDLMEDDKNNKGSDIQKEQLRVSGRDEPPSLDTRDEPPSLDILSLNEPNNEPRNLNSLTDQGCREASSSGMLEREQNVEPQPSSSLFNAQVNNSDQGYCKSPTNVSTPSMWSPQCSENQKDQEWALSPSHHGSPQRQSPRRYPEDQKHKEWSVSPPRDGTPHWPEGQHHEDRSHHSQRHHSRRSSVERQGEEQQPQRHHSRWSSVERQGEEQQPHSQRQRFSPDGRGGHSTYSDRHRQNRPMYYDNSRGQRGRRMQNASRGRGTHARRGQYAHNQRFTSASQMQPSAQPGGYPSSDQYPVQSNEQYANMQNGQTYDQMWQYYYYYQQQQQLMLMQQQQMQPQQQLPDSQQQTQPQQQTQEPLQSQQQLQMQANQMQLLQFQYQQQQLQLQSQLQQQDVSEQPQRADVHLESQAQQPQLHGDLQTQQQQLYQQMQQQQQQLYQQMQQQQQLYQQMQLHGQQQQQPQQEQSNQAAHAQQQQQQWQTYQYQQQQYLLYLQQLQQQPGGHSQAQVPQQQVLSAEKEEQNESQLQQEQQLPQTPGEQQDGGHENEGAS